MLTVAGSVYAASKAIIFSPLARDLLKRKYPRPNSSTSEVCFKLKCADSNALVSRFSKAILPNLVSGRSENQVPGKTPPREPWRIIDLSEIEVPSYSSEAIEQIAAILGVQGQAALTDLRSEIEDIAARYLGLKQVFDQAPKAAKTRGALAEILETVDTLLERLENLDDETRIALDLAASGSKVTPVEAKFGGGKGLVEQGEEEVGAAIQHIYNFQAIVSAALDLVAEPKRGRHPVIAFDAFVWMLAHTYERETKRKAGVTLSPEGYRGPFFNLVKLCVDPLMNRLSPEGLGKRIQRALKARSKQG